MFRALFLSLGQLGDPVFLKGLAKSLALTILLFVIPVINLFVPILSAAMTAHMLHGGMQTVGEKTDA